MPSPPSPKVSGMVTAGITAVDVRRSFGGVRAVRGVTLEAPVGAVTGLVGPNGAGKTTLINLLTGQTEPDTGTIKRGTNLTTVLLDQARAALDPETTVSDVLTGGRGDSVMVGERSRHVIGYLKDFLFSPEQARTPVRVLSGGERNRLLIAKTLAQPANLLVLDEPTNDLDLETLDLLQEMLCEYAGTLILVSHDRDFLDRVVGSVLVSEGEGRWVEYAGGYSDMLAQRGRGVEARGTPQRDARKAPTEAKAEKPTAAPPPQRRKLGFREQHELKTLPGRMEEFRTLIAKLRSFMSDPSLYARDPSNFAKASAALAKAEADLAAAEESWLELEIAREELGA